MLDGLLGRNNFKTKCKSALTRTKTRLEVIKKKRNAMERILKTDIAELLKSNHDRNAYARVNGLYLELTLSSCYEYVEECCTCIAEHLQEMHKQRECPEECKTVVASLIYAAARFADLPELRDLRTQFYDKYSKALESFVNKEFVQKFKLKPPTREMKLQLMHDIAQEFSVTWDPKPLEQQLQSHVCKHEHRSDSKSSNDAHACDDSKFYRTRSASVQGKEKQDDSDKEIDDNVMTRTKMRHSQSSHAFNSKFQEQHNKQEPEFPFSASTNNSEDTAKGKPFTNRIVPVPNYRMTDSADKHETDEEDQETNANMKPEQPLPQQPVEPNSKPVKSDSFQKYEVFRRVLPKVPDFDELAKRIAALRKG